MNLPAASCRVSKLILFYPHIVLRGPNPVVIKGLASGIRHTYLRQRNDAFSLK